MWCCKPATPFNRTLVPSVSGTLPAWRRHRHGVSANGNQQSGKLGDSLSGSDVLWALQRASGGKKNKKDSSSVVTPTEDTAVDYTNVRPFCINANWGAKLDDLDKRLRELSHTI